jgi:hypothetical protein
MNPAATENYSGNIDQILWSRIVFGSCAAMGTLPFFGWPFALFAVSSNEPVIRTISFILACLTIFPACILAFWHRVLASIWLVIVALLFACLDRFAQGPPRSDWYFVALLFFPGIFGMVSSALHWPPLIEKKIRE